MNNFTIDRITPDEYTLALNNHSLGLGNNYTAQHLDRAIVEALGYEVIEELHDLLAGLDCPSWATITLEYNASFGYHKDDVELGNLLDTLDDYLEGKV